jgi:hypothetical protein
VIDELIIPNGISWSLDDKTMYFTDSGTQSIYAYDYDAATGNISNKRDFFRVEEEGCAPYGHVMDVEGNIWVAIWGGWKVVRINPEGKVTAEIKVPTRCPTVSPQELYSFVISFDRCESMHHCSSDLTDPESCSPLSSQKDISTSLAKLIQKLTNIRNRSGTMAECLKPMLVSQVVVLTRRVSLCK